MIREKTYVLALDNGTQSVRAIVFDEAGNEIAKGKQEIEPYFSRQPGWAEQEPSVFWSAVRAACQKMWQTGAIQPQQISAVTLTTQRGTVICVDESGTPLRPAIIWLDQRRANVDQRIGGLWGLLFRLAGVASTVQGFREKTQANWLQQNEPDLWRKTHKFLLLSGYLSYRLTGEFVDSSASQVGYIPFDYKRLGWAKQKDWKWRAMPVQPSQLPRLVKPGHRLGELTSEAADWLGLAAGLPVFAAASDKACEIIGSGGHAPNIACMSYGTTATINTTSQRYLEAVPFMPPYPSAIPDRYCTEVMIYRGFWMVSWFRREFGLREEQIAVERGIAPEALFDELVTAVPPGSMGLMLQPYWSPGTKEPGPEAKGAIIGFGDVHTRAHIYRAILEGLAYALKEGAQRIERKTKIKIDTLMVSGGGSQSDAAMQLTADIFNLPAQRPHTYETSALGAAIDAMVGLGIYQDFDTAIKNMTRVAKVFKPQSKSVEIYSGLYNDIYLKMYQQLKPLYKKIQTITGYPS